MLFHSAGTLSPLSTNISANLELTYPPSGHRQRRQNEDWELPWQNELEKLREIMKEEIPKLEIKRMPNITDLEMGGHTGNCNTFIWAGVGIGLTFILLIILVLMWRK